LAMFAFTAVVNMAQTARADNPTTPTQITTQHRR
jgi:hypothetical protein